MAYKSVFAPALFAGKVVLVTGGGSGIGRCVAHELAALGAPAVLIGRKADQLQAVAAGRRCVWAGRCGWPPRRRNCVTPSSRLKDFTGRKRPRCLLPENAGMTHHLAAPAEIEFEEEFVTGLKKVFEEMIVFNQVLGLKITSLKPTEVRGRIDMKRELIGHFSFNRIHGGVISAGLDAMAGLAVMAAIGARHMDETPMQRCCCYAWTPNA